MALAFSLGWALQRQTTEIMSYNVDSWLKDAHADCAVVLTGGPHRMNEGVDLLYRKSIKTLIVAGVNPASHIEEIFPNLIFYGDLNLKDIVLEKNSKTTFGNAHQALPLVEAFQCKKVLLITSRLHMYRSIETFKAHFPAHISLIPHAVVGKNYEPPWTDLINEAMKSLFYSLWAY